MRFSSYKLTDERALGWALFWNRKTKTICIIFRFWIVEYTIRNYD